MTSKLYYERPCKQPATEVAGFTAITIVMLH